MRLEDMVFIDPTGSQLERLLPIARRIFSDTFSRLYDRGLFEQFCDDVYCHGGVMSRDFDNPEVRWRLAVVADEPIGYAKLTPLRAPAADPAPRSLELQQLYVTREWHGRGVADCLMAWALETARAADAGEVYLTVFDHNERAKRFYSRYGFEEVGRCTFKIGDRIDDDRIWRVRLSAPDSGDASERLIVA